ARCAVAWGGKAASEPTESSAIATCLIRGVAHAQGWCHAPTRAPKYGPSHYATIRAHRGSISVAPLSHFRHQAPGRRMRALTRALWGILPFGELPRRRHNAKGRGLDQRHCCHLAFPGTGSAVGGGDGASASRAVSACRALPPSVGSRSSNPPRVTSCAASAVWMTAVMFCTVVSGAPAPLPPAIVMSLASARPWAITGTICGSI